MGRKRQVGYELEAGFKLDYPLEDWIVRLLRKYPLELARIVPSREVYRIGAFAGGEEVVSFSGWNDAA